MKNLKYLFTAEFKDNTPTYKQTKEDASVKFPPIRDDKGVLQGQSAMADIQADIDRYNVKQFTLTEQKILNGKMVSVDLTDGHFEINGVPFDVEGDRPLPTKIARFKLIYFRVRRDHYNSPAAYFEPQNIERVGSGLRVTTKAGETHFYPEVVKQWVQNETLMVGDTEKTVQRTYILPKAPLPEVQYMLGWQTTIAGKNYQQVILV